MLEEGRAGVLVNVDDADALARAVSGLVWDGERRKAMVYAARPAVRLAPRTPRVADRRKALFALMASAWDLRLPRASALEPMRIS